MASVDRRMDPLTLPALMVPDNFIATYVSINDYLNAQDSGNNYNCTVLGFMELYSKDAQNMVNPHQPSSRKAILNFCK